MVETGTASSSEHSALVELESGLVCLNGYRHRLLHKSRHEGRVRVLLHIRVRHRSNLGVLAAGALRAGAILAGGARSVRVARLSAETAILLSPSKGLIKTLAWVFVKEKLFYVVHQSSVASTVSVVARNQVLLREGLKIVVLDLIRTLESTSGRKGPARTAVALVLHTSDGTLGGPVNRGRKSGNVLRGGVEVLSNGLRVGLAKTETHVLLELLKAHMRELIMSEGVGDVLLGVVGLNHIVIVGEVLKHMDEVMTSLDLHTVLTKPVKELSLIELTIVDVPSGDGGSRKSDNSSTVHGERLSFCLFFCDIFTSEYRTDGHIFKGHLKVEMSEFKIRPKEEKFLQEFGIPNSNFEFYGTMECY